MPDALQPFRILAIGAHPDDCEIQFGGTAAKLAAMGHAVKFLSVTNGDKGHAEITCSELARIRAGEAAEAAERLGIAASEVLHHPDGQLIPSIEARCEIVRQIRSWRADVVLTHRPYDYHPDHRYTAQLVQDSAYLVMVPHFAPEVPALAGNPVYLFLEDRFQKPLPFSPDFAVDIDDVWETKLDAFEAHESQFFDWLPWIERQSAPVDPAERRQWLDQLWTRPICGNVRASLARRYGPDHARKIQHAEAFELCEYGRRPSPAELEQMFPR